MDERLFSKFFRNHLTNISCHEVDFGIKVTSYNFFGTGHGKTENDGNGGTVKRTVSRHNLRSSADNQITNAYEMFRFAKEKMESIR